MELSIYRATRGQRHSGAWRLRDSPSPDPDASDPAEGMAQRAARYGRDSSVAGVRSEAGILVAIWRAAELDEHVRAARRSSGREAKLSLDSGYADPGSASPASCPQRVELGFPVRRSGEVCVEKYRMPVGGHEGTGGCTAMDLGGGSAQRAW